MHVQEADAVIMLGGIANRKLQQDVQFDDGQVSVNGAPIATVDTGPDGGQITGVDGSVVGFGPDGAGAPPLHNTNTTALFITYSTMSALLVVGIVAESVWSALQNECSVECFSHHRFVHVFKGNLAVHRMFWCF